MPVPEQQRELRRIRKLHAEGLSPYKISADLASRGVKLCHVTIRKMDPRQSQDIETDRTAETCYDFFCAPMGQHHVRRTISIVPVFCQACSSVHLWSERTFRVFA
jgi:hypothetical protein